MLERTLKSFLENYLLPIDNNASVPFYQDHFISPYLCTDYGALGKIEIHYYPLFKNYVITSEENGKEAFSATIKKENNSDIGEQRLLTTYKSLMATESRPEEIIEETIVETPNEEFVGENEAGEVYQEGGPVKERKNKEVYFVQGNYGSGWDDLTSHDNFRDAKAERKVYDENESYPHRVIMRRVKMENYKAGNFAQGGVTGSKGGKLVGASHAEDGIKVIAPNGEIEVEGGEVIINKEASDKNCELLSEINQSAGDGVKIPCYAKGSKVKNIWEQYDFENIEEYYDYILDSYINGQLSQVKDLYNKLSESQKKAFFVYVESRGASYDKEVIDYINKNVRSFAKGGKTQKKWGVYVFGGLQDTFSDELTANAYADSYKRSNPTYKVEVKPVRVKMAKGGKFKQTKEGRKQDKRTKAKHPGKRVTRDGTVYYEHRRNRADINRTKKL